MKRTLWVILGLLCGVGSASAQTSLADYDYENLSFRGFSLEGGYILPNRVNPAYSMGGRLDLGYLGPGLRIVPGISFWSSTMVDSEVEKLEGKVDALIRSEIDPDTGFTGVDLGQIDWSDIALSLDAHFVWSVPYDFLTFLGGGVSAHLLNGEGEAIGGTFVEDLLDSVTTGFNVHTGIEYPVFDRFRLYGLARYEIMEDLRYAEFRLGGQIQIAPPAPGEERGR